MHVAITGMPKEYSLGMMSKYNQEEKVLESEPNFEFRNLKKGNLRLPEPQALQNVENPVGNAKSVASVREILSRAQLESNPILRNASFAQALGRLNAENLQEVLETFESMPLGFEHMHEYRMLLYAWGQFDPIAAIDYCKMRASGIGAGFATLGVLEGWASRDPQSARTWVEHPENEGMAKLYNFGLVRGWASRDLEAAGKYVQELGDDEDLTKISGILINQHKKGGGFAQASTWTEGLSNGKLKEGAFNGMSREFARDQPRKLASWLETHANNKYASNAFEYLGKKWSETDPRSSIEYFSNLPVGKSQELGIKGSISIWAKQDPTAAGEWLNQRESGPELDSALVEYATIVSRRDGAAAMEWAISITNDKLQQNAIRAVGQEWYRQDKESVEKWLPESGLSEEMQKKITKPPKKNWWQTLHEQ